MILKLIAKRQTAKLFISASYTKERNNLLIHKIQISCRLTVTICTELFVYLGKSPSVKHKLLKT